MFRKFNKLTPSWLNGSGAIENTATGIEYMREVFFISPYNAVSNRPQEPFYEYEDAPRRLLTELETEFAFRELLDLNAESYKAVSDFMGKWGLLYHPQRFSSERQRAGEVQRAINLTDKADKEAGTFYQRVISIDEAMAAAKSLQRAVGALLALDSGEGLNDPSSYIEVSNSIDLLNAAGIKRALIGAEYTDAISEDLKINTAQGFTRTDRASQTTLTEQICLQAIDVLTDNGAEWRRCAHCGRLFKDKRDATRKTTKRPSNPPVHCSKTCTNNAKIKRYRAKQKAKPRP